MIPICEYRKSARKEEIIFNGFNWVYPSLSVSSKIVKVRMRDLVCHLSYEAHVVWREIIREVTLSCSGARGAPACSGLAPPKLCLAPSLIRVPGTYTLPTL
jgi:hypothetical protein